MTASDRSTTVTFWADRISESTEHFLIREAREMDPQDGSLRKRLTDIFTGAMLHALDGEQNEAPACVRIEQAQGHLAAFKTALRIADEREALTIAERGTAEASYPPIAVADNPANEPSAVLHAVANAR